MTEDEARNAYEVGTGYYEYEHLRIAFDRDHGWIVVDTREHNCEKNEGHTWVTQMGDFQQVKMAVRRFRQMNNAEAN